VPIGFATQSPRRARPADPADLEIVNAATISRFIGQPSAYHQIRSVLWPVASAADTQARPKNITDAATRGAAMSKIPQGEWNAIAARYQNGESISKIARSYNCTPPAIHYILKRSGGRLPEAAALAPAGPAATMAIGVRAAPFERIAAAPPADNSGRMTLSSGSSGLVRASATAAAPPGRPIAPHQPVAPHQPITPGQPPHQPIVPGQPVGERRSAEPEHSTVPPAATPGLDGELHNRAEAAIATFRSSFDAALAEGSPLVRERLRQAASDLMRVAARTTMVLDRVNAGPQRSGRLQNYPRSAHGPDDFGRPEPA
jgi:hypothetical protein